VSWKGASGVAAMHLSDSIAEQFMVVMTVKTVSTWDALSPLELHDLFLMFRCAQMASRRVCTPEECVSVADTKVTSYSHPK